MYREHYISTKARVGKQRGTAVARIEVARKLTEAIWYLLTPHQAFSPADPAAVLAAETAPNSNWVTGSTLPFT